MCSLLRLVRNSQPFTYWLTATACTVLFNHTVHCQVDFFPRCFKWERKWMAKVCYSKNICVWLADCLSFSGQTKPISLIRPMVFPVFVSTILRFVGEDLSFSSWLKQLFGLAGLWHRKLESRYTFKRNWQEFESVVRCPLFINKYNWLSKGMQYFMSAFSSWYSQISASHMIL